tara:strand:- start:13151 stop:13537 length:387 start_codon:yes stop_codon:yes gene_type:complete
MGTKIKAKYDGACKFCGEEWIVGDDLYYQKNPKAICSDEPCFNQQGGVVKSFTYKKDDVIITKIPDIDVGDSVKQVAEMLQQYVVVAHHLTKSMYPELDVNTHTFGQIRSKIIDQLQYATFLSRSGQD